MDSSSVLHLEINLYKSIKYCNKFSYIKYKSRGWNHFVSNINHTVSKDQLGA